LTVFTGIYKKKKSNVREKEISSHHIAFAHLMHTCNTAGQKSEMLQREKKKKSPHHRAFTQRGWQYDA
jgi:hypothetical protein